MPQGVREEIRSEACSGNGGGKIFERIFKRGFTTEVVKREKKTFFCEEGYGSGGIKRGLVLAFVAVFGCFGQADFFPPDG